MAVKRSRRLRKKLHLDEFRELGFMINFTFAEGTEVEAVDAVLDRFIDEVVEPNGLAFDGSGYLNWDGLLCLQKIGECEESHRKLVADWLTAQGLKDVKVSKLFDIWWDMPVFE